MNQSVFFLIKAAISGALIAAISSLAKTFPKWAALLTALPHMTFLSLIWIYFETRDLALLERYTKDVFIWVVPSLIFLIAAFYLFRARVPFFLSLGISTAALFALILGLEKLKIFK